MGSNFGLNQKWKDDDRKAEKEILRSRLSPETEILIWGSWLGTLGVKDLGLEREPSPESVMRAVSALLDLRGQSR